MKNTMIAYHKLSVVIGALLYVTGVFAQAGSICTSKNTYVLKPFDGPLTNPHKGFTFPTGGTWSFSPQWEYGPGGSKNNEAWKVVTYGSGYQRWDKLNPERGVYDWTDLEKLLNACEKQGMGYALRVFPYASPKGAANNYTVEQDYDWTPQFVYAAGAKKGSAKLTYNGTEYTLAIPVWDDPVYLQAHKEFAAALAEKYDGDPRIEYIDVRSFGNWGEWHVSHLDGSEMPSVDIQKDMLTYYASIFHKTLLVLPSSGKGEVYEHAIKLGIAKRDDGLIATPKREETLVAAYEANLPTIGENYSTYANMLTYNDVIPGGYLKWTPERWKNVIKVAHLTYYVLDQDSDAGYRFYNDNKAQVDSMTKVLGYNFTITNAHLLTVADSATTTTTLNLTVKNTGVAPCFFDVYMVAELVDSEGSVITQLGETCLIPKGTFKDDMVREFEFATVFPAGASIAAQEGVSVVLSLFESENAYKKGDNPTVRFDNEGLQENRKLLLESCNHEFGGWDTVKVATTSEPGLRRHNCTRPNCESYEEEWLLTTTNTGLCVSQKGSGAMEVAYTVGNTIYVSNVSGETVCLYDSKGELCGKKQAVVNEQQFSVVRKGVYFVVVNNRQHAVLVR